MTSEQEALDRLKRSAQKLYQLFLAQTEQTKNYFEGMSTYEDFLKTIASLSSLHSIEDAPEYISWRIQTAEVVQVARDHTSELQRKEINPNLHEFHGEFVEIMHQVDAAIQFSDWARNQRRIEGPIWLAIVLAGILLVASLVTAIAAEIKIGQGISDTWNFVPVSILLSVVLILALVLVSLIRVARTSSIEWINELVKKLRSEMFVRPTWIKRLLRFAPSKSSHG